MLSVSSGGVNAPRSTARIEVPSPGSLAANGSRASAVCAEAKFRGVWGFEYCMRFPAGRAIESAMLYAIARFVDGRLGAIVF